MGALANGALDGDGGQAGGRGRHDVSQSRPVDLLAGLNGQRRGCCFAVTFAVAGMLIINRLPKLHHPLFGTPRFGLASEDRFFLYIGASDPKFDNQRTRAYLGTLGAWTVEPVLP